MTPPFVQLAWEVGGRGGGWEKIMRSPLGCGSRGKESYTDIVGCAEWVHEGRQTEEAEGDIWEARKETGGTNEGYGERYRERGERGY